MVGFRDRGELVNTIFLTEWRLPTGSKKCSFIMRLIQKSSLTPYLSDDYGELILIDLPMVKDGCGIHQLVEFLDRIGSDGTGYSLQYLVRCGLLNAKSPTLAHGDQEWVLETADIPEGSAEEQRALFDEFRQKMNRRLGAGGD